MALPVRSATAVMTGLSSAWKPAGKSQTVTLPPVTAERAETKDPPSGMSEHRVPGISPDERVIMLWYRQAATLCSGSRPQVGRFGTQGGSLGGRLQGQLLTQVPAT